MEQTTDQPESKTDYFFFEILNIKLALDFNTTLRDSVLEDEWPNFLPFL